MKEAIGKVLVVVALIVVVFLVIKGRGLGFGSGRGTDQGKNSASAGKTEADVSTESVEKSEKEEEIKAETDKGEEEEKQEFIIEIKKSEYYLNGKKLELTDIKKELSEQSVKEVRIDDIYASVKAYEELKTVLDELKVIVLK